MYVLEVENLIRNYQKAVGKKGKEDIKVLKGLNFQVEEGDFTGIMGKSGCGKTTLLKVLGMIDKQTDGTVRFMGQDTKGLSGDTLADIRRTKLGFIFQDYYLMDSLTVEENIMLPMILGQEDAQKMMDSAKAYAEKFQIDHLLNKNPYELSGGERVVENSFIRRLSEEWQICKNITADCPAKKVRRQSAVCIVLTDIIIFLSLA